MTDLCFLCGDECESYQHLFFKCKYSASCLQILKEWLNVRHQTDDLQQLIARIQQTCRFKFKKQVVFAGLIAIIYFIRQS